MWLPHSFACLHPALPTQSFVLWFQNIQTLALCRNSWLVIARAVSLWSFSHWYNSINVCNTFIILIIIVKHICKSCYAIAVYANTPFLISSLPQPKASDYLHHKNHRGNPARSLQGFEQALLYSGSLQGQTRATCIVATITNNKKHYQVSLNDLVIDVLLFINSLNFYSVVLLSSTSIFPLHPIPSLLLQFILGPTF